MSDRGGGHGDRRHSGSSRERIGEALYIQGIISHCGHRG